MDKLDKNTAYHVHCAGGYRSIITISLLMQNGFSKLTDITGGFDEIVKTNIPTTDFVCPSTLK
jgi:rhodanese-related sulfurtransferase